MPLNYKAVGKEMILELKLIAIYYFQIDYVQRLHLLLNLDKSYSTHQKVKLTWNLRRDVSKGKSGSCSCKY